MAGAGAWATGGRGRAEKGATGSRTHRTQAVPGELSKAEPPRPRAAAQSEARPAGCAENSAPGPAHSAAAEAKSLQSWAATWARSQPPPSKPNPPSKLNPPSSDRLTVDRTRRAGLKLLPGPTSAVPGGISAPSPAPPQSPRPRNTQVPPQAPPPPPSAAGGGQAPLLPRALLVLLSL